MHFRTVITPREARLLGIRPLPAVASFEVADAELSAQDRKMIDQWRREDGLLARTSEIVEQALHDEFRGDPDILARPDHVRHTTGRMPAAMLDPAAPGLSLLRYRLDAPAAVRAITQARIRKSLARLKDMQYLRDYHLPSGSSPSPTLPVRFHALGPRLVADWPLDHTALVFFFPEPSDIPPGLPAGTPWFHVFAHAVRRGRLVAVRKVIRHRLDDARVPFLGLLRRQHPADVANAEAAAALDRQAYLDDTVEWACTSRDPFSGDVASDLFITGDFSAEVALVRSRREKLLSSPGFEALQSWARAVKREQRTQSASR